MLTVIGLYTLFRMRRPGVVVRGEERRPLGTYYGMPSGDAMMAAICGAALWKHGARLLAIILPIAVSFERLFLGLHDLRQVAAGVAFGWGFYLFLTTGNTTFNLALNWILAFVLPLLVFADPALADVRKGDFDSLQGWVIVSMGYLWFEVLYCAPPGMQFGTEGTRLGIAVGGALLLHIAYTYSALNGVSLVRRARAGSL
jgi:hypothetical protein